MTIRVIIDRPPPAARHATTRIKSCSFTCAGLLRLSLRWRCSQCHTMLRGLLIRGSHAPLKFASDHTRLYLLTRECLHHANVFLSPRTQLSSLLRHLSSPYVNVAPESATIVKQNSPVSAAPNSSRPNRVQTPPSPITIVLAHPGNFGPGTNPKSRTFA